MQIDKKTDWYADWDNDEAKGKFLLTLHDIQNTQKEEPKIYMMGSNLYSCVPKFSLYIIRYAGMIIG